VAELIPVWEIIHISHRSKLLDKVTTILDEASKGVFSQYIRRKPKNNVDKVRVWLIENNPLDLASDKRSREYRHLLRLQSDFLNELQTGVRPEMKEQSTFDFMKE
jgi:hypothetical protein